MKTKRTIIGAALALGALAAAVPAHAVDPWEGGYVPDDGVPFGYLPNALSPGLVQLHDLDEQGSAVNDEDWASVPTLRFHSYEARVSGTNAPFDPGGCGNCAQFERVTEGGAVLTEDVAVVFDIPEGGVGEANDRSVRWIADSDSTLDYVRVRGSSLPENQSFVYAIRYWDTTYRVPRWNAANGQATVIVLTSLVPAEVAALIHFFGEDASLVATQPVILSRNKPYVLSSATLAALAGRSGYALVAHDGGYGALTGKAVSVEPATGFTFDTALEAIPQ
jgi:hypothetical protein